MRRSDIFPFDQHRVAVAILAMKYSGLVLAFNINELLVINANHMMYTC